MLYISTWTERMSGKKDRLLRMMRRDGGNRGDAEECP